MHINICILSIYLLVTTNLNAAVMLNCYDDDDDDVDNLMKCMHIVYNMNVVWIYCIQPYIYACIINVFYRWMDWLVGYMGGWMVRQCMNGSLWMYDDDYYYYYYYYCYYIYIYIWLKMECLLCWMCWVSWNKLFLFFLF